MSTNERPEGAGGESASVDLDCRDPRRNMYGVLPCPRCRSKYRHPTQDLVIHCDSCDLHEQGFEVDHA